MATLATPGGPAIHFSRRLVEWGLMAVVVGGLLIVFLRYQNQVQAQAEVAGVRSTLAALRTALVIDHLKTQATGNLAGSAVAAPQPRNPFDMLQQPPGNYLGEFSQARAGGVQAGSWVFDPACTCIGYIPLYAQWHSGAGAVPALWFRVEAMPPPARLKALAPYTGQGQPVE